MLQVTCRLCSERELVSVDAGGKELRPVEGEKATKAQNVTIGIATTSVRPVINSADTLRLLTYYAWSDQPSSEGVGAAAL